MPYTEKLCPKVVPSSGFRHITVYYINDGKYSPNSYVANFPTQISSSQREERTIVFTRKKMIRPIRIANDVFSRVKRMIRPIRSHRGVWVSRQNSRVFLQLAERRFAHIWGETFFSKSFLSLKKWKTFEKRSGIVSVSYTHLTLPTSDLV